jgi:hypothetical protein
MSLSLVYEHIVRGVTKAETHLTTTGRMLLAVVLKAQGDPTGRPYLITSGR